jgi:hypothetical protein
MKNGAGQPAPGQGQAAGSNPDWGAAPLVWSVWAAMTVALGGLVAICGANFPLWDEWQIVDVLIGKRPITLDWLWGQYLEHRLTLPRIAAVSLATLTDCDFRAGMFASVLCLSALSFVMIATARRLRGHSRYTDIVFPLLLLHFAHKWNVLQGWNIHYTLFVLLVGLVLAAIARCQALPSAGQIVIIGVCLFLLCLEGAPGIITVPALALWLACAGLATFRVSAGQSRGLLAIALALVALGMLPLYFYGLQQTGYPSPTLQALVSGTVMFFSTALGSATAPHWLAAGLTVLGFILAGLGFLAAMWLRDRPARIRTLGLLAFLGSSCLLALAVSWGRSGLRDNLCLESRYSLLSVPALLAVYLIAELDGLHRFGRLVQFAMCVAGCVMLPFNTQDGLYWADKHRAACDSFRQDLLAGWPPRFLVHRHSWLVPQWRDTDLDDIACNFVEACMGLLHVAHVGLYSQLHELPPCREVNLPAKTSALHDAVWHDGAICTFSPDGSATFRLESPRMVYGMIVDCSLNYGNEEAAPARVRVAWQTAEATSPRERSVDFELDTRKGTRPIYVWINERIDHFELSPGPGPSVLHVSKIALIVPPLE